MGSRTFKDSLYAEFAVLGKALANPHRLELLDLLAQGERSVEELAKEAALSRANASAHLQVLRQARLAEIDRLVENYFTDRDELEAVDKEELLRLLEDEAVIVIDTRPEVEYEQGHISSARSVPVENLRRWLAELPRDVEI